MSGCLQRLTLDAPALSRCAIPSQSWCRSQHRRICIAASGNSNQQSDTSFGAAAKSAKQLLQRESGLPWYIGFQTNERTLEWEESAQIQLLKIYVAEKSSKDVDWVHDRLCELVTLLPDIVAKLNNVKADLLLQLLDTKMIAQRLIDLEEVLPGVDLSSLTARYPAILLEHSVDGIRSKLASLREALPEGVQVERLVEKEPVLLDVQISTVLQEIRRLLPAENPTKVLLRDPSIVLDMNAFRMGSSLQDDQAPPLS